MIGDSTMMSPGMKAWLDAVIEKHPPLTPEEESEIVLREGHNRERLNELLVLHNVALIVQSAKAYALQYRDQDVDDMIAQGLMGMWQAAKNFDLTRGVRFSTYCIYKAKRRMQYRTRLKSHKVDRSCVSLNRKLPEKGEEGGELIDFIQSKFDAEFKETSLAEWLEFRDGLDFADRFFTRLRRTCLSDYEMSVLYRRTRGETLAEIAKSFGRTPERVRQVVEVAKTKVRAHLKWRARVGRMNWDKLSVRHVPNKAPDRGRTIYSSYMAGWVAWERYKLGIKKAAPIAVREETGPVLTSEGFTAKRFVVKGRTFVFKGGKWLPAPKEEDYGFNESLNA